MNENRAICTIAREIKNNWGTKVNYAAKPYLDAMLSLDHIGSRYGYDDARSIILYFLANASTYRGEVAKAHKAELKTLAGMK